jgi:cation:H+ antiporter
VTGNGLADAALLLIALGLLWKGADWVILAASRIAHRLRLSDLVIGLTIVSLGTSAPEIVCSLVAALRGHHDIAVANVVGSNIFNLGFILGGVAIFWTIPTSHHLVKRDTPALFGAALLLLFFLRDHALSRGEGLSMLALLAGYGLYLFMRQQSPIEEPEEMAVDGIATWRDVPRLLMGLAAVIGGAHLLIHSAVEVASGLGVSEWAIGVTIVAGGTSLPELACSVAAAARGRPGIVAGNLVGSDLHNILAVLGIASVMTPLSVDPISRGSVIMMTAMIGLLIAFMRTGWRLSRVEGLSLCAIALMRWGHDLIPGLGW